jgi:hypothetical protein
MKKAKLKLFMGSFAYMKLGFKPVLCLKFVEEQLGYLPEIITLWIEPDKKGNIELGTEFWKWKGQELDEEKLTQYNSFYFEIARSIDLPMDNKWHTVSCYIKDGWR